MRLLGFTSPVRRIYTKMMIDGMPSNVFSATTLKPWQVRPSD